MWLGSDDKVSIRRSLALIFSLDFIRNLNHITRHWDPTYSYADVAMLLGLEAGLIAALLSLTTYASIATKSKEPKLPSEE